MAQVKVTDLTIGKELWVVKYDRVYKITVDSNIVKDGYFHAVVEGDPNNIERIFVRDRGVRPLNYDNRPTQLFFTKEEAEQALAKWGEGINPNFLEADESENT